MSYSSLWVMDKKFYGEEIKEFQNSWLFTPIVWDILAKKYINQHLREHDNMIWRNDLFPILNEKVNDCESFADRVVWELSMQSIFFAKNKKEVADTILQFGEKNKTIFFSNRYREIAAEIAGIDGEKYPYFLFKNTSVDDAVEKWFEKYNEEAEEYEPISLAENPESVTEFVIIEGGKIVGFEGSAEFCRIAK